MYSVRRPSQTEEKGTYDNKVKTTIPSQRPQVQSQRETTDMTTVFYEKESKNPQPESRGYLFSEDKGSKRSKY